MTAVVVTSREELAELVREAVREELSAVRQDPLLVDRRSLAARLGLGLSTVDRMRERGCPHVQIGDSPRFVVVDVLQWLKENS